MYRLKTILLLSIAVCFCACSSDDDDIEPLPYIYPGNPGSSGNSGDSGDSGNSGNSGNGNYQSTAKVTVFTDNNGARAFVPDQFSVSSKSGERVIKNGLVVIGPDGSEFVWVPTTTTELKVRDFGSYFSGGSIKGYQDETSKPIYQAMIESVKQYGGFYMGRYEASYGSGSSLSDYVPASKPVTGNRPGRIWVRFSPQDATVACENLYRDNGSVQGFFPWGINWDTTLQWLIDSGCKTREQVANNSTSWGNYSDDTFSLNAGGNYTGAYEEAKANNIYDLAGNNWEWTQERNGTTNYVMRGGGYNLMGGSCSGSRYPAAVRDPLPGNDHHPNVCFRVALFLKLGALQQSEEG